jgi:hypothetical protein
MIELHGRQSRALSLELLHDEVASPDLVSTFMNIRMKILVHRSCRIACSSNCAGVQCNGVAVIKFSRGTDLYSVENCHQS